MTTATSPSVLQKVRQILEALAAADAPVGLSELARRSGVPKATVHRLCNELVDWGVIERVGVELRLGSRLFELGQCVPKRRVLRDAALPFMEDLFVATRQTSHLAVPEDLEAFYVERITGRGSDPIPSRVGGRVPLHCTATGKCILAFGDQKIASAVLASALPRATPYTIQSPQLLTAALRDVRDEGYAVEREEHYVGYASVAAPVFERGGLVGAISITTSVIRMDVDRFAPSLRTAALGLSRQLGAEMPSADRHSDE